MSRPSVRSRQRGMTLIEIMLSMGVVLVGMLGLFRVLSVAARGSSSASRITQGQTKAQQLIESINAMPKAVIDCLVQNTAATAWGNCETQCQSTLAAVSGVNSTTAAQSCVFTMATMKTTAVSLGGSPATMDMDSTRQRYAIVYDTNSPTTSTWVQQVAGSLHLYQAQVTIGWNDDGSAPAQPPYDHRVTLKTDIFRN